MAVLARRAGALCGASNRGTLLRHRYWVLGTWGVLLALLVLQGQRGGGGDWNYFTEGYGLLLHGHTGVAHRYVTVHVSGGGLRLYATHPDIQIGPLALLLAGPVIWLDHVSRFIAPLLFVLLGLGLLAVVERAVVRLSSRHDQAVAKLVLWGGAFVMFAWVQVVTEYRHLDDMLVAVGMVSAVWAIAFRRPWALGVAIGLAVAAKPTALVLLPLVLAMTWRENLKSAVATSALVCACWLPFIIAAPGTIHAGAAQIPVEAGSGLTVLGFAVGAHPPTSIRAVQLLVALAGGGVAVARRRWYLVPLIGFGLRTALDPSVASYYALSVALAALIADSVSGARAPWATVLAWLALSEPLGLQAISLQAPPLAAQAWMRLVVPIALALVVLVRTDRKTAVITYESVSARLPTTHHLPARVPTA